MNEFRNAFREAVKTATKNIAVRFIFISGTKNDLLTIPKQNENGFEILLECMDYGVYSSIDRWNGGCWDVTGWEPDELKKSLSEFISSILSDAIFEIHYSNGKPYKWILHHIFEGEPISTKHNLLFYNWFGKKTSRLFSNGTNNPSLRKTSLKI